MSDKIIVPGTSTIVENPATSPVEPAPQKGAEKVVVEDVVFQNPALKE